MNMDVDYDEDTIHIKNSEKIDFIERKIHLLDFKINEINSKLDNLYDNFLIILKSIENQNKIINNTLMNNILNN